MRTLSRMAWPWRWAVGGLILFALVPGTSGCGDGKHYGKVSGQVLRQGKPVTGVEVNIDSRETGTGAQATVDDQGRFVFPVSLEAGTYTLFVTPEVPAHPQFAPARKIVTPSFPRKYRDAKSSGLSVLVKEGKNDVLLDLAD